MQNDTIPTVPLSTLINGRGAGFSDRTFELEVRKFMAEFMPGFPLGLLERDFERWERVQPDADDHVEENDEGKFVVTWDGNEEVFDDEDEAIDTAQQYIDESYHDLPWAWNWAHQPDKRVTDDELMEVGFVVAWYTGGDEDEYRLAGIDGGGLDFTSAFFAQLAALVHWNRRKYGWTFQTDNGEAYVNPHG